MWLLNAGIPGWAIAVAIAIVFLAAMFFLTKYTEGGDE